jgi:hypothetical protein
VADDTCEGCPWHKRDSGDRWQEDWCYEKPGEVIKRQSRMEYWSAYPIACSKKPKEATND